MQFKQTLARLILILCPAIAFSQSTYLSQDAKENILIDRLEILGQKDTLFNFSKDRPLNRAKLMKGVLGFKQSHPGIVLSKTAIGCTPGGNRDPMPKCNAPRQWQKG